MAIAEDAMKDWKVARTGISLLLNNKTEEAEALFTEYPHSFHVKAGRCFVLFMVRNRVMSHIDSTVFQRGTLNVSRPREKCCYLIGFNNKPRASESVKSIPIDRKIR